MKTNKENVNRDMMKVAKKYAREEYGFTPTKVSKSKKDYNRKEGKKVIFDEENEE